MKSSTTPDFRMRLAALPAEVRVRAQELQALAPQPSSSLPALQARGQLLVGAHWRGASGAGARSDDALRVIEMTIVKAPFVLDFAGAHLDGRPEFPEESWADWEADKREKFEDRWPEVRRILDAFEELGVYLLDVSPSNITFRR